MNGYFLKLRDERMQLFLKYCNDSKKTKDIVIFSEPVDEFLNSPSFISLMIERNYITRIMKSSTGYPGGTNMRILNLDCTSCHTLKTPITIKSLIKGIPSRYKHYLQNSLDGNGAIPAKTFSEIIKVLTKFNPDLESVIKGFYNVNMQDFLNNLSQKQKEDLAFQQAAVIDTLNFTGINRSEIEWSQPDVNNLNNNTPISYLSGLKQVRLRETEMIHQDLNNLPGFDVIKKNTIYESVHFSNHEVDLTILLTDKKVLEEDMGVDLIYYNEKYKSFVLVQYKAMEDENSTPVFRFPNRQLTKEIVAMDGLMSKLLDSPVRSTAEFRVIHNPFFLKICPRIVFNPDSTDMISGMYIPIELWKQIEVDDSFLGKQGGRLINFENLHKRFNNTDFKMLLVHGWIGTKLENADFLIDIIRRSIETGKRVLYAYTKVASID